MQDTATQFGPYETAAFTPNIAPRPKRKIQPLRAWKAMGELLKNKENTQYAFHIVDALAGEFLQKDFERFLASPDGIHILQEREELGDLLLDRSVLAAMPDGSLGRAYLSFVQSENLSADELINESLTVSADRYLRIDDDLTWYQRRLRDMHDLFHVLTGYGREGLGEACVLSFTWSQNGNNGTIFMAYMAGLQIQKRVNLPAIQCVSIARKEGKRAVRLSDQRFSDLLQSPLKDVRNQLNINPAPLYASVIKEAKRRKEARKGT